MLQKSFITCSKIIKHVRLQELISVLHFNCKFSYNIILGSDMKGGFLLYRAYVMCEGTATVGIAFGY